MSEAKLPQVHWDAIEAFETELLRAKTIQEKIQDYVDLMNETWLWKPELEDDYFAERAAARLDTRVRLIALEAYRKGRNPMESQLDRLTRSAITLQTRLAAQGIASALLGGLAYAVWANPRFTKDADLRILLSRDEADKLLSVLGSDYRPLNADPARALRRNGILFVQDDTDSRIDLMLADTQFDQDAVQHAKRIEMLPGLWATVVSAEDLIIYKMISTRAQDAVDVEQIIRVQGDALDDGYVIRTLRDFQAILDGSTLVATYQKMRRRFPQ